MNIFKQNLQEIEINTSSKTLSTQVMELKQFNVCDLMSTLNALFNSEVNIIYCLLKFQII